MGQTGGSLQLPTSDNLMREISGPVRAHYRDELRTMASQIGIVCGAYALIVLYFRVIDVSWPTDAEPGPVTVTVSVPNGAAIIAVLATVGIALNLSARGVNTLAPASLLAPATNGASDAAIAYARFLLLSQAALTCAMAAALTGVATLFGAFHGGEFVSCAVLFLAGCLVAALGADAGAGLKEGPRLHAEVSRRTAEDNSARLRRLLDDPGDGTAPAWSASRCAGWWHGLPGSRRWGLATDFALIPLVSGALLFAVVAHDIVQQGGQWWVLPFWFTVATAISVVDAAAVIAVCVSIVRRELLFAAVHGFFLFVFTVVCASGLVSKLDDYTHPNWYGVGFVAMVTVPILLCARVFRPHYNGRTLIPGTSVRRIMRALLQRSLQSLDRRIQLDLRRSDQPAPDQHGTSDRGARRLVMLCRRLRVALTAMSYTEADERRRSRGRNRPAA